MRLLSSLIYLISGLSALTLASVINPHGRLMHPMVNSPQDCDFHCTRSDMPICATNGQCMQKFQSECLMSAYNCKQPQKPFVIIQENKCENAWAPLCSTKRWAM